VGLNPLTQPTVDADEIIRRRRSRAVKSIEPKIAWVRAFEAVILFYEKKNDPAMADLLRLDLDRFDRERRMTTAEKRGVAAAAG
jgi:hypothetical protein